MRCRPVTPRAARRERLEHVGPDALAKAASEVDIVLDHLWGKPAADTMLPLLQARSDRSRAQPLAELPSLIEAIDTGDLHVSARPIPLTDVTTAWTTPDRQGSRSVLVPVS